ncbi:unnamed protein product [Rhizophagus irregularis]|nr:unnamed protein product [Rhizophagus irregularis]
MAEWTDLEIRILIDEHRIKNNEFHNLGRNWERFWGTIADKINQENGTSFNGHQCKEKFSNLVRDYNTMCDFMSGKSKARSRTGARYFDEFRTHFWERSEDEFDRVCRINTFNQKRSRGSGYITPIPSTRNVERELRSSERRRRQFLPVRERHSELLPVSSLITNDEMDISDTEQLVGQRKTSTHEELSLSLYLPPSYDIATAQESSNVRVIYNNYISY